MNENVLITGSNGFIGSRIHGGKTFLGSVENSRLLWKETTDVVGIVHLAAKSNSRICEEDPIGCFGSNILGTYNVLMTALQRKIWVLFISTYQVRERNLYGLSKLMGEELCRIFQNKGVRVKILRLPIVYGPGDKADKVVTKIISEIKHGVKSNVNTNKKFYFLYVDDVANIIESEVDILQGNFGRKYSLCDLIDGIKKCVKQEGDEK